IDNPTVGDLNAIGTSIQWYDVPTGGTALSTALALTDNSTYYATQTVGSCESDTRLPVTVTVADPASPTGTSAQSFCSIDNPTVADLIAIGTAIQWYDVPTGGSALSTTLALTNNSTYYASQTIGGCESDTRLAVTVTVADPASPTGTSAQSFCSIDNPTVADLIAIGTTIQWYDVPTGGSALSTTLALTNNSTYYASQTIGTCESDTRLPVTVTVADPSSPTGTSAQSFCSIDNPTVADLIAIGTAIQWYDVPTGGSVLSTALALTNNSTYYASQTIGTCESDTRLAVTVTINQNPSLTITDPSVCAGNNALIVATTTPFGTYNYNWSVPVGVTDPGNTDSFVSVISGNYALTVTDNNNCSATASVSLNFYANPSITEDITDESCPGAQNGSISLTINSGTFPYEYLWSNSSSSEDLQSIGHGHYTVTVTDINNCTTTQGFEVNYLTDICLNIPTAFSPNGDGINDTWEIEYIGLYEDISIEIYNRWGQLIFSYIGTGKGYEDLSNRWDGTYNAQELPLSSFVFILDLKDGKIPIQGIVTIIK
ncbi:MAG: gliding motility-associated C-terminal domain-containing protein, partial [Bacteroidales bacterium]|nr:gliding motility-associated C-terminal domain-containing protein [Bacteroidales bacterium]